MEQQPTPLSGVGRGSRDDNQRPPQQAKVLYGVDVDFAPKGRIENRGKGQEDRRAAQSHQETKFDRDVVYADKGNNSGYGVDEGQGSGGGGVPYATALVDRESPITGNVETDVYAGKASLESTEDEDDRGQERRRRKKREERNNRPRRAQEGRWFNGERRYANIRSYGRGVAPRTLYRANMERVEHTEHENVRDSREHLAPRETRMRGREWDRRQTRGGYRSGHMVRFDTDSFPGSRFQETHTPVTCFTCGKEGHLRRNCPEKEGFIQHVPPIRTVECYSRGYIGQSNRQSYMTPRVTNRRPITCYHCHEEGHYIRDCTKKVDQKNGTTTEIGDDTGHEAVAIGSTSYGQTVSSINDLSEFPILKRSNVVRGGEETMVEPAVDAMVKIESGLMEEPDSIYSFGGPFDAPGAAEDEKAIVEKEREVELCGATAVETAQDEQEELAQKGLHFELIRVDQFEKSARLQELVLRGGQDYKDDVLCECKKSGGLFSVMKCQCRKNVIVFINQRLTVECTAIVLAAYNVTPATVHCDMNDAERKRNLLWFKRGRHMILLMMASELALCSSELDDVDWLVFYDLPMNCGEFKARMDMFRRDGKPLHVTAFFDESTDTPLAEGLEHILKDAGQHVPEWLGMVNEETEEENESETDEDK